MGAAMVLAAVLFLVSLLCPAGLLVVYGLTPFMWTANALILFLITTILCLDIRRHRRTAVWQRMLVVATAFALIRFICITEISALANTRRQQAADTLRQALPAGKVVYRLTEQPLLVESFYLKRQVIPIKATEELPTADEQVYVLGEDRPPILETRIWNECSPLIQIPRRWHPQLRWDPASGSAAIMPRPSQNSPEEYTFVRIYCGTLRPPEDIGMPTLP
jgi:hypothetical protein